LTSRIQGGGSEKFLQKPANRLPPTQTTGGKRVVVLPITGRKRGIPNGKKKKGTPEIEKKILCELGPPGGKRGALAFGKKGKRPSHVSKETKTCSPARGRSRKA